MAHVNAPPTPAVGSGSSGRCDYRPIAHVAAEAGLSRPCPLK